MALRYIPLHLKHSATPKITDFAVLAGLEAAVRGTLISTVPIAVYDAFGSASNLSTVYLAAGIITLFWGLLVPRITQMLPRRWVYSAGCALYLVAMALFIMGTPMSVQAAILISGMATVTTFVCLNAYVLDYVARADLGDGIIKVIKCDGRVFTGQRQQHINLSLQRIDVALRYRGPDVAHMQKAQAPQGEVIQRIRIRIAAVFRLIVKDQAFRRRK
jgi:hypothetical protein